MEFRSYKEVADDIGLHGLTKKMYIKYMETRWKSEEEIQCKTGYAHEWAERFKSGYEFGASDSKGRDILLTLCRLYYDEYYIGKEL